MHGLHKKVGIGDYHPISKSHDQDVWMSAEEQSAIIQSQAPGSSVEHDEK